LSPTALRAASWKNPRRRKGSIIDGAAHDLGQIHFSIGTIRVDHRIVSGVQRS
jgi:hypothetical protein